MSNSIQIEQRLINIENLLQAQKAVFNLSEVANYTGLSRSYLYKLTSTGRIPCYKPNGKQIFFDKKEIDVWLLRNRIKLSEEIDEEAATIVTLKKKGR